uniref:Tubulin polyglutamylase ttll6 n=1 Tax=Timema monikensis TaxID=170555 RepID=A0A7R9DY26_9NEOP|nr:unnamed protein product [Timema monikensis]
MNEHSVRKLAIGEQLSASSEIDDSDSETYSSSREQSASLTSAPTLKEPVGSKLVAGPQGRCPLDGGRAGEGGESETHTPHHKKLKDCVHPEVQKDVKMSSLTDGRNSSFKRKKKKRKKSNTTCSRLTICTANCRYDVVRRVATRYGMKEVSEEDSWNLYWTDVSVSVEKAKDMKRFQKINHFPGMSEICRKDLLARNLNRMLKIFPKDYNFFPKTWCLPADFGDLLAYARNRKNRTYICKPDTGSQGRGIFLTKNVKDIKLHERMICQLYLSKPFLVDGFKFDLRVYVLITSCDPLRVYVYNDGLARFATSRYQEPTTTNTSNVFMHLTNYSVNKHSRTYVIDDQAGSKRKISTLNSWLQSKDYNVVNLWTDIDEVIIKTIVAAHPILRHSYHACFTAHDFTYACFELLGFDILLDNSLKPYILEVNHSPSYHTDACIDREVKEALLTDTFQILNLIQTDKKKIIEEDRRRIRERLLQGIFHKDSGIPYDTKPPSDPWQAQAVWEESHMGNFRCIYPGPVKEKFERFFHQNASSLFQDTAASRAREECTRLLREEMEAKAREELARRAGGGRLKEAADRLRPESPMGREHPRLRIIPPIKRTQVVNSFKPDNIVEEDERERMAAMLEREQLVQSYSITNLVLEMVKRSEKPKRDRAAMYGLYGKLSLMNECHPYVPPCKNRQPSSITPLMTTSLNNMNPPTLPTPASKVQGMLVAAKTHHVPPSDRCSNRSSYPDVLCLTIQCNNVPITSRPVMPALISAADPMLFIGPMLRCGLPMGGPPPPLHMLPIGPLFIGLPPPMAFIGPLFMAFIEGGPPIW